MDNKTFTHASKCPNISPYSGTCAVHSDSVSTDAGSYHINIACSFNCRRMKMFFKKHKIELTKEQINDLNTKYLKRYE